MLHNCSSTNRKSGSHQVFLGYKLICNNKEVIVMRRSKKDRQHNGQNKKEKRTNYDLQSMTQKTKDMTRTPLNTGGELRCS